MNKDIMKNMFNKADLILIIALSVLGACSLFVLRTANNEADHLSAVVTVSGEKFGEFSLDENRIIPVNTKYGSNVLAIEDGKIFMSESFCPNHDCENFGKIGSQGQMIICIPNRLVVTIEGSSEPEVDAVLY